MTDDDIKRARAICDSATPGPWAVAVVGAAGRDGKALRAGGMLGVEAMSAWAESAALEQQAHYTVSLSVGKSRSGGAGSSPDDASFIAAARTLLPAALDEIERLNARLVAYTGPVELLEEVERLREDIYFMRDRYTMFGGRPCPACLYEDGKFIRSCQLHEYISAISGRADEMEAERDETASMYATLLTAHTQLRAEAERLRRELKGAIDHGLDHLIGRTTADERRALRAEVNSLRTEVEMLRNDACVVRDGHWSEVIAERDAAQAEVEAMRPVVEAAIVFRDAPSSGGWPDHPDEERARAGIAWAVDAYRAARGKL